MTCMTTKKKFDVENPPVTRLANGRFAYRVRCPWDGKNGKELYAFKFCGHAAYREWCSSQTAEEESEHATEETSNTEAEDA